MRGSKRRELEKLFAANRRLFKAYVLREQLVRLWTYKTPQGVGNFLLKALRWQRLPEMERLQQVLGLGSYETAWTWLHKLRRAMVRPGRDRLTGRVEGDEAYIGGVEEGVRGRHTEKKALIAVAAEENGEGIGRIRMRRIPDATADSFQAFIQEAVAPGSLQHTDGLLSYDRLEKHGYRHRITFLKGRKESASQLLPRVHRVVSLLKRWQLGTHQGAVSRAHLDYYPDEFTFRFNRRTSRHRGKLFYRLVQQAVAVDPAPYASLVKHVRPGKRHRRHHKI